MPFLETIGTASAKAYGEGINNITQSYWFFTAKDASGTPGDGNVNLGLDQNNNFLLTGNTNVASAIAMSINTVSGAVNYQNLLVDPGGSHLGISYGACADNNNNQYWAGLQNNSSNQQNAWLAQYNSSGSLQWQRIYSGNTSGPYARFWNIVSDGINVYPAGYQSTNSIYNASAQLGLIAKYNSSGARQWSYNIVPGSAFASGGSNSYTISIDSAGNIYSAGSITTNTAGYYGGYTAKINSSGVLQWATTLTDSANSSNTIINYASSVDSNGNVYMGGYTQPSTGGSIGFIAQLNSSGVLQWSRYIFDNYTTKNVTITNVWPDNNGNIYVFAQGLNSSNQSVGWIAKYNTSGVLQFQRNLSNPVGVPSFGMGGKPRLDSNGNLCFTGSLNQITGGGSIAFAIKLPSDGSLLGTYSTSQSTFSYTVGTWTESAGTGISANTSPGITLATAYNGDATGTLTNTTGTMVTNSVPYNLYISTSGVTTAVASGASSAGSVTAGGGSNNFSFTISSGSLPTGLSLNSSTGAITGGATTTGSYSTVFQVTDTTTSKIAVSNTVTFTVTAPLYAFPVGTSFTFTNAGNTGQTGPSLVQVQSAYSATSWTQNTAFLNMTSNNGIQLWTVPDTGTYQITVAGAKGGIGDGTAAGGGAVMVGTFSFNKSAVIKILVGQLGGNNIGVGSAGGGGGGGSYVTDNANTALIVAGGGNGGNWAGWSTPGPGGQTTNTGTGGGAANGRNSGGGGFAGNGTTGGGGTGGSSFLNGGAGGNGSSSNWGGFGGGGGSLYEGGGGGGYTGGTGVNTNQYSTSYPQYGAGSYNSGTVVSATANSNNAVGYVTVLRLS